MEITKKTKDLSGIAGALFMIGVFIGAAVKSYNLIIESPITGTAITLLSIYIFYVSFIQKKTK